MDEHMEVLTFTGHLVSVLGGCNAGWQGLRPFSKNIDIKLAFTSHYTKEAQATNPIKGRITSQTDSMAVGRDCREVTCVVVSCQVH